MFRVIKETITLYLLYLFTEGTVQGADFTHHIEYLGANLKLNKQISISFIGYRMSHHHNFHKPLLNICEHTGIKIIHRNKDLHQLPR